jgi:hypothetical protein
MKRKANTLGLYFALFSIPGTVGLDDYLLSRLGSSPPPAAKEIPSLVFLMESFCHSTAWIDGRLRQRIEWKDIPQCRENGVKALQKWGLTTVHECLAAFARRNSELTLSDEILSWDSRNALLQVLGAFSRDPLPAEARAWGSFAYEDEQEAP